VINRHALYAFALATALVTSARAQDAFPAIADGSTLRIALERGPCFGDCPVYSVEIRGDGTVIYDGGGFVAIPGKHITKISRRAVSDLVARFREIDFLHLQDQYSASITDQATYQTTIAFDGRKKSVIDYAGPMAGMPKSMTELEDAIDVAAGIQKWIKGDADTMGALRAEGWDFHSQDDEHQSLLESASGAGDVKLVEDLLAAGASANTRFGCDALEDAAYKSNLALVKLLVGADAPPYWPAVSGDHGIYCDALQTAAQQGVPEIVTLILGRHPDVNARDASGETALMFLSRNDIAFFGHDQDFAQSARLLIAAGADVNARDDKGYSVLMDANHDVALVRVLLDAGARDLNRPDPKSKRTPLMLSADPDVTQVLLEAGADPYAKDGDGKTALDSAQKDNWRKTAPVLQRWMAQHPQKLPN